MCLLQYHYPAREVCFERSLICPILYTQLGDGCLIYLYTFDVLWVPRYMFMFQGPQVEVFLGTSDRCESIWCVALVISLFVPNRGFFIECCFLWVSYVLIQCCSLDYWEVCELWVSFQCLLERRHRSLNFYLRNWIALVFIIF